MNFDFSALNFETIDSNINAYPDMFLNQDGVTFTKKVLEDLGYPAFVLCLLDAKARVFAIRSCKSNEPNPHFRQVAEVCFKNAVIVADRYHVIRQVYWAMERVRKNEKNKLSARFRKYFKKSKYLLMKPIEKLTEEEADRLALMFEIAPRLADAYRLKNEFLTVIRSKSSAEGKQRLVDWLFAVEVMGLPEFHDCTKAYHNWFNEILNSMDVPWSNGFIEGCNNKTKVLKRVCFGMRNFRNFKNRILFCHT